MPALLREAKEALYQLALKSGCSDVDAPAWFQAAHAGLYTAIAAAEGTSDAEVPS
jgi:hypothetical protein